jgi:hypothetical protein
MLFRGLFSCMPAIRSRMVDRGTLKVRAAFRTLDSDFDCRAWIACWIRSSVSILSVLVVVMVVAMVVVWLFIVLITVFFVYIGQEKFVWT